ncbi:DUF1266 domain-containing protein [Paenibacillus sp. J2TS4]|uniref:DUF1266 domain-containing protein n=1 Tax=Paenibacillus sp. J2TS4 TaxID=2807194 RepID=UPI001B177F67|nr:DUF1266 domain-containing protein [Paenibacillus sp. J2TS4]GIP33199.1 hypothetical protein J2TS4_24090 [Paenibacillus sp. J2TS4]
MKNNSDQANHLKPADLWCLALGAILFELDDLVPENNYDIENNEEIRSKHRHSLQTDWGIDSRETLLKALDSLVADGHNRSFSEIRFFLSTLSGTDQIAYLHSLPKNSKSYIQYQTVHVYNHKLPGAGIAAWDWGRYIYLCKKGAFLGYLTDDEARNLMYRVARMAQQAYSDWLEYGISYLVGRQFWLNQLSSDKVDELIGSVQSILLNENSLWCRLDWNLKLES